MNSLFRKSNTLSFDSKSAQTTVLVAVFEDYILKMGQITHKNILNLNVAVAIFSLQEYTNAINVLYLAALVSKVTVSELEFVKVDKKKSLSSVC